MAPNMSDPLGKLHVTAKAEVKATYREADSLGGCATNNKRRDHLHL